MNAAGDWTEHWDEHDHRYWYNSATGETSWDQAAGQHADASWASWHEQGEAAGPSHSTGERPANEVLPGWLKEYDESSKKHYYTNPELGLTQWEPPTVGQLDAEALAEHTS